MSLTDENLVVLGRLRTALETFAAGGSDLDTVQTALQQAMTLLESDEAALARTVRLAEADVEEIRFTMRLERQGPAVQERVAELLTDLP